MQDFLFCFVVPLHIFLVRGGADRNVVPEYMLLYDVIVSTLFHDADDRLITGRSPSFHGGVLIAGKMLKLQPV